MSDTIPCTTYNTFNNAMPNHSSVIRVYLGGSFDPVHIGHLAILHRVYNAINQTMATHKELGISCNNKQVYASFLPAARSPLKLKTTPPMHRLAMLALTCVDTPFTVCDIEIYKAPPTYTIDTFKLLREEYPLDILIFVLGADSAATLSQWQSGASLINYCHLWIIPRNTCQSLAQIVTSLPVILQRHLTDNPIDLKSALTGYIYIDTMAHDSEEASVIPTISSSHIRQSIQTQQWQQAQLGVLPTVYAYIRQQNLYTPL